MKRTEFVRHTFFPKWDRKREWQIVEADDLDGAQGKCDLDTKTVSVLRGVGGDDLTALLIHEIAHAVTDGGHGKKWLERMEKAAEKAESIGLHTTAKLLQEQIAGYRSQRPVKASDIYHEITACVWGNSNVTFPQAVDFVRRDYGLGRADFLGRFRRAKRVFDEAKLDAKEEAKARARFLAMGTSA